MFSWKNINNSKKNLYQIRHFSYIHSSINLAACLLTQLHRSIIPPGRLKDHFISISKYGLLSNHVFVYVINYERLVSSQPCTRSLFLEASFQLHMYMKLRLMDGEKIASAIFSSQVHPKHRFHEIWLGLRLG